MLWPSEPGGERRTSPARLPAVVMASGFGSTHDRLIEAGVAFADAGFAVLAFDYRGFGASEGGPRQVVDLPAQRADIHAAIAFLRGQSAVDADKICLWGNSLGGGHVVVVAAEDPRVAAVIAQIPFNGFPDKVEGRTVAQTLRFLGAAVRDQARGIMRRPPRLIPLVGMPGEVAITTTPAARAHIASLPADTLWRNEVAPRATLAMTRYRPSNSSPHVAAPILVCLAEGDAESPIEKSRLLAERARDGKVKTFPGDHFSFYRDPVIRAQMVGEQITFLRGQVGLPDGAASM